MKRLDQRAYKLGESSVLIDHHGKAYKYTLEEAFTLFDLVGRAAFFGMLNRRGRDIYRDPECATERRHVREAHNKTPGHKAIFDALRRRQMVESFVVSRSGEHEP